MLLLHLLLHSFLDPYDYQQVSNKHAGTASEAKQQAEESVKSQLEENKANALKAKKDVVSKLLKGVVSPHPALHSNA